MGEVSHRSLFSKSVGWLVGEQSMSSLPPPATSFATTIVTTASVTSKSWLSLAFRSEPHDSACPFGIAVSFVSSSILPESLAVGGGLVIDAGQRRRSMPSDRYTLTALPETEI
jgi:hypothetical protein